MSRKETLHLSHILDATNLRKTKDGYLTAMVRCARTGVQKYRGAEVGAPELKDVFVYRPEEEVFHKDSLATYPHKPVTNDHPPVSVDSETWKKYSVGGMGESVARDGQYVVVPMLLMDQDVIDDYEDGKRQLSMGYTCDLIWDSGVSPEGEHYDAVQRNIRTNHLAVVSVARGGPELKIGDDKGANMTLKTMTVDSISVEMPDIAIQVVDKAIKTRDTEVSDLKSKLQTTTADLAKIRADAETQKATDAATIATKDAELKTVQKQLEDAKVTPQALDAMVTERVGVINSARQIIGDKLLTDGKTVAEIRRQVVDAYLGDVAKDFTDDQVIASFAALCKDTKPIQQQSSQPSLAQALGDRQMIAAADAEKAKAYKEYEDQLTNAWKNKSAAA